MRVGIIGLLHESNTFIDTRTTIAHFQQDVLVSGPALIPRFQGGHHEISGFLHGLSTAKITAVPIFAARALPGGRITAEAYQELVSQMERALAEAGPLDGILAACHGADVAEGTPDASGDWLARIRRLVGHSTPVVGTLDLHANLSEATVQATDALLAYRTNPHVDQYACGLRAAQLLARTLGGEVHPTQAAAFPPLIINIERQATASPPCADHFALADWMLQRPGVLSNSLLLGFPYADVPHMGAASLVVTDNDRQEAVQLAGELARGLWNDRQRFVGQLTEVEAAIRRAATLTGPVCLLDMGDNVGGGAPGDGTVLITALVRHGVTPACACVFDPQVVWQAQAVGARGRLSAAVGGKTDRKHGESFRDTFTVVRLHDGRFTEPEPRHGGFSHFDQGPTAVLESDTGLTLLVHSQRMAPFSLQQLLSCGIDPRRFRCLVAKGVHAPVAAYREVCQHFIRVNTPGVTTADLNHLDYKHCRRPLFPLDGDFMWFP